MNRIKIKAPSFSLVEASWLDCFKLYYVRYHETVRRDLSISAKKNIFKHIWWYFTKYIFDNAHLVFLIMKNDQAVGLVSLMSINKQAKEAELGIMIVDNDTHPTLSPLAAALVFDFAIKNLGIENFYGFINANNTRSIKATSLLGVVVGMRNNNEYKYLMTKNDLEQRNTYLTALNRTKGKVSWCGSWDKYIC